MKEDASFPQSLPSGFHFGFWHTLDDQIQQIRKKGRLGRGIDESPGMVHKIFAQNPRPCDKTAHQSGRLPHRVTEDRKLPLSRRRKSPSSVSFDADGMGLIQKDETIPVSSKGEKFVPVWAVPIHTENAFGKDPPPTSIRPSACLFDRGLQMIQIVVLKVMPASTGHSDSVENACMAQSIHKHLVPGTQERLKGCDVRRIAAVKEQGRFRPAPFSKGLFGAIKGRSVAADQSRSGAAHVGYGLQAFQEFGKDAVPIERKVIIR